LWEEKSKPEKVGHPPVKIPAGYVAESARSGNGIVYRLAGSTGNANTNRVMGQTPDKQHESSSIIHQGNRLYRQLEERVRLPKLILQFKAPMYGLRKNVDLSFLNGRQVEQIAIGTYQIIFGFDEDVKISAYIEFRYFDGEEEWIWKPEPSAAQIAGRSVSLLGSKIRTFEGQENGTLTLVFSNGRRLTILDSSKEYESYDITCPGQTIVV
jgi:Family of unknown function (DUF6188)